MGRKRRIYKEEKRLSRSKKATIRKKLLVKLRECSEDVVRVREKSVVETGEVRDDGERSDQVRERDIAVTVSNGNHSNRRQIEVALERLEEGTYGICEECDRPIAEKRLEAIPWARLCISCQEEAAN